METKIKRFDELTARELYEIVRSRTEIFLLEQRIICQDFDGIDYDSLHCFIESEGRVVAYLRAYPAENGNVKIGRVLSLTHGIGLGTILMKESLPEIKKCWPGRKITLHAQKHAKGFYERFGFSVTSPEFLEEGVPHVEMAYRSIAFLGDSITYGHGLADASARYATLVSKRLCMDEENYGISGTLVAKAGLNRADGKDFLSRVGLIDSADVAVIFGGTNDYFWSDKPICGEGEAFFEFALERMCEHVLKVRKGKITLFVAPYPHNGVGNYLGGEKWNSSSRHDTGEVNFNGHTLPDYARVIERVCQKYGLPCLNLHKNFEFDHSVHTLDGCHPNEEGHRLLADAVEEKLRELLEDKE